MKRLLLAIAGLFIPTLAYAAILLGPLSSGSVQVPPVTGTAPVVASLTCNIALPIISQSVVLVGGGSCRYTATCNATSCVGMDAITSWAITAQSTANSFAITNAGILQGGSAAAGVTSGAYTVTVTATNATGTSPGVVQTVNAFAPPVVAALACTIKSPVTNNVNVVLQAGGNCQYTATCASGACSGGNAITAWTITTQTRTNGYKITSGGILQGGSAAASITNETDTVTITASNAGGTSPAVAQTVTAITVPTITNQNFSRTLPMVFPDTIGTMVATANPTSWAITAVTGGGTGATTSDFAISNAGVLTTTSSAPADITVAGTAAISVTATNATGTSATGTATLAVVSNPPPLVQSKTCNVTPPVTNGVAVSPSCTFTATCGGGSCIAPYAIIGWNIVSQTHANGFAISSGGVLQGGSNSAATTGANTVTVTATNSVATSPAVGETVNVSGTAPVVSNGSYVQTLPLFAGNLSPAMSATPSATSWAVTGVSGDNAQMRDFSITSGGVLALTSFAPTDITTAGTVTINVGATNAAGTGTGTATMTVNAASTLPPGVTLQAIDGESMTGLTMSHNYYGRNNFTRVTAGTFNPSWDSTSYWPIISFYLDSHFLPRAVDLGYTAGIDDVFGTQIWSNYDVSKVWHFSSQPGAGGPPNPASDFVAGWYTDEPQTDTIDVSGGSPLFYNSQPGTSLAGGPTFITQTSHSVGGGLFGSSQGTPFGPPMTSVVFPNTFWTTPNPGSQHRGVDINGADFYWFAYSTAFNFRKHDCGNLVNRSLVSPDCTTDQMARCSGYGNNISGMRNLWFGNGNEPETVPATTPLGVFTENGAGNDSANGSRNITPGEMICSVWDAIIHGARATLYFYWVDVATSPTNDPIYVATKSTNALIKAQAQMLNAPFARDYLTMTVSDGNANSYVFPHWNSVVSTGWFGGGIDAAVKWFGSKFYILATTKYGESGYATKTATFHLAGGAGTTATVIYSSDNPSAPSIPISGGQFADTFPHPWSVRIYRID